MTLSDWCILIGWPLLIAGVAGAFAYHGKVCSDIITAGVVAGVPAYLLNRGAPPLGAIALVLLTLVGVIGTAISVWRGSREGPGEGGGGP